MNNGSCKHCNASFDGDLVYETFLKQGLSEEEAKQTASYYAGFKEHGLQNRWGRQIGRYCMAADRTVATICPDCKKEQ